MLAGFMTYFTVGFSLLIVTLIIFAMSFVYRIREQAVRGASLLFFSLAFLFAARFQNIVTERLLNDYMTPYPIVKQLDVSVINGFKGPLITPTVATAAWTGAAYHLTLIAIFILITGTLTAYISSLMMGWDSKLVYAFTGAIAAIALAGTVLTYMSVSTYTSNPGTNTTEALNLRTYSNLLKGIVIIAPYAVMALGSFNLYRETKTLAYAVYSAAIVTGLIGFLLFITTWTYGWDLYVEKLASTGDIGPAVFRFTISAFLMIVGALGLLIGSILETMPPAEEVEEFE